MLEHFRKNIALHRDKLRHALFTLSSDKEIFELVRKANLSEEEFDPAYDYLPQLSGEFWARHLVQLDETIDAYSIVVIDDGGQLKFIWEGWRAPCPGEEIGKIFSVKVPYDAFFKAVDNCLLFLKSTYSKLE